MAPRPPSPPAPRAGLPGPPGPGGRRGAGARPGRRWTARGPGPGRGPPGPRTPAAPRGRGAGAAASGGRNFWLGRLDATAPRPAEGCEGRGGGGRQTERRRRRNTTAPSCLHPHQPISISTQLVININNPGLASTTSPSFTARRGETNESLRHCVADAESATAGCSAVINFNKIVRGKKNKKMVRLCPRRQRIPLLKSVGMICPFCSTSASARRVSATSRPRLSSGTPGSASK